MPLDVIPYQDESDALAAWLRARCGKLTSSRMRDAMATTKKGEPTAARTQLLKDLCAERVTQMNVRHYVNPAMQHGIDQQKFALAAYEAETGYVANADRYRFTDHPAIDMLGASDDGFVGHDGIVEIKCPTTPTFMDWRMSGVVPEEHKAQMIVELDCTGRRWCDFVAFDPRIKDPALQLFIRRYEPTPEERAPVLAAAEQFLRELDELFYRFTHG